MKQDTGLTLWGRPIIDEMDGVGDRGIVLGD